MKSQNQLAIEGQSNQWHLPRLYMCFQIAAVARQVEVGYFTDWPC